MKIYRCNKCGNIVTIIVNGGGPLSCCGESMNELVAESIDAAQEKHVPSYQRDGNSLTVQVGKILHPMTQEHYIQMILVRQEDRVQYVTLKPGQTPIAVFEIEGEKPATIYEYCNLHGLWMSEC